MANSPLDKPFSPPVQVELPLEFELVCPPEEPLVECPERFFRAIGANALTFGSTSMRQHLLDSGQHKTILLHDLLLELHWEPFLRRYQLNGRRPFHPRHMLGLILQGILAGRSSLRELEEFAKVDIRAMYAAGGFRPDHSTLGSFLVRHRDDLSGTFFETLTSLISRKLKLHSKVLAADGTVIDAVSSRFQTLTAESARAEATAAAKASQRRPQDPRLAKQARAAASTAQIIQEAQVRRNRDGASKRPVKAARHEPEAQVLMGKRGVANPAYIPSALVDENALVVGAYVTQTNERAAVEPMLDQHRAISEEPSPTLLLDGAYHHGPLLEACVKREIDVLCPKRSDLKETPKNPYSKESFQYDEERDGYVCPAGVWLSYRSEGVSKGRRFRLYRAKLADCRACPLQEQCSKSRDRGRAIKRYPDEEYCKAMKEVMSHPRAQKVYRKRRERVELFFAILKEQLGLRRFRRRGLAGARLEYALYCMVYNVRRGFSLGLLAAMGGLILGLGVRDWAGFRRVWEWALAARGSALAGGEMRRWTLA